MERVADGDAFKKACVTFRTSFLISSDQRGGKSPKEATKMVKGLEHLQYKERQRDLRDLQHQEERAEKGSHNCL